MKKIIFDWCQLCEDKKNFDKSHFYTLFNENITQDDLKIIFKYFPNANKLFDNTYDYLFGKKEIVSFELINRILVEFALKDVNQKKTLLNIDSQIFRLIDNIEVEFIDDYDFVQNLCCDYPYLDFFDSINDILIDNWIIEDKKTYALYEAFYGLTNTYEIVWSLFSPLFSKNINFQYYTRLKSLGGIYSFHNNKLLVSKII